MIHSSLLTWCRDASLVITLIACGHMVFASTPLEREISAEPPPHKRGLAAAGPRISAHWVRQVAYLNGASVRAEQMRQAKASVDACITTHRAHGLPVQLIEQWPDELQRYTFDIYTTPSLYVSYSRSSSYAVNAVDCSLLEFETSNVSIRSSAGFCDIDRIQGISSGDCDMARHRAAPPDTHPELRQPRPPKGLPGVAYATGETKNIAGAMCDVVTDPLAPGGTQCYARSSSFNGFGGVAFHKQGTPLSLEARSDGGVISTAEQIQFDLSVADSVLLPPVPVRRSIGDQ